MEMVPINRPNTGTLGRPICLESNHFLLDLPAEGYLYHYHVDVVTLAYRQPRRDLGFADAQRDLGVKPEVVSMPVLKDTRRRAIAQLVKDDQIGLFRGKLPVFDGQSNLYSVVELNMPGAGAAQRGMKRKVELDVKLLPEGRNPGTAVRVAIQVCTPLQISWSILREAMEGRTSEWPAHIVTCADTVLREAALSAPQHNIPAGRSYFAHTPDAFRLGAGRITYLGFCASARPCQYQMSVNLDVAHGVFYEDIPLPDLMKSILHFPPTAPPLRNLTEQQRRQLMPDLKGLRVSTSVEGKIRYYVIASLSRETAEKCTFELDGQKMLVSDYFRTKYSYHLQFPGMPMVETSTKCLLPIELCDVVDGQKVKRRLTEQQTATMIRSCTKPAPARKQQILDIRRNLVGYDTSPHMEQFGMRVAQDMQNFRGRVLPVPTIGQGSGKTLSVDESAGTWDARRTPFDTPKPLNSWAVVLLDDCRDPRTWENFLKTFMELGAARGMHIEQPFQTKAPADHPDFIHILDGVGAHFAKRGKKVQLVMIANGQKHLYAGIKTAGDVVRGVPTQVVLFQTLVTQAQRGRLAQYVGNILLKVNAKLGGVNNINYTLDNCPANSPLPLSYFVTKPTIVFGADVSHPGFGEHLTKPSLAAVVATCDSTFTTYSCRVNAQLKCNLNAEKKAATQEVIINMAAMVRELLEEFLEVTDIQPEQIVFFRDGVSEGQFKQVLEREVMAIKKACRDLVPDGTYNPPLTYIVVGKNHHVRLFHANQRQATSPSGNIPPGTVVETNITHFKEFDFYLASHTAIQGTTRPAHYNILYDDSNLSADQIQLFSYYLSFLSARCNRSVSIPPPIQYADLAATRARVHLKDENMGSDTMSGESADKCAKFLEESDLVAMNERIRTNPHLTGMYFA